MSERSVFLSMSLMVTTTPGTTAPVGSVTLPVTSAELVAWPHASDAHIRPVDKASPLHRDSVFMVPSRKRLQVYGGSKMMSSVQYVLSLFAHLYLGWRWQCANRLHLYSPTHYLKAGGGMGRIAEQGTAPAPSLRQ